MISLSQVHAHAGKFALVDITFDIPRGNYGVIIGPAGAGKTTLLETIAGLVPVTSGTITLDDRDVTRALPEHRGLGIVYQHGFLFPHLSVRQNVAYGARTDADARDAAERFGVQALDDRSVESLSGGERQLVALARALARKPDILLLDEPFSALDPRTRRATRQALRTLHVERQLTVLQVTHDFTEAEALGDVVIVLEAGRVTQQGPATTVFRESESTGFLAPPD